MWHVREIHHRYHWPDLAHMNYIDEAGDDVGDPAAVRERRLDMEQEKGTKEKKKDRKKEPRSHDRHAR